MNSSANDTSSIYQDPKGSDGNLSLYIAIIFKHKRFIGIVVAAALLLSIIISFLIPKMYRATTLILPPRDTSPGLASLFSGSDDSLIGLAGTLTSGQTPAALYVGIMKSRSVAESLERKFELKKVYGLQFSEDVHARLANRSVIDISKKDQLISVSVMDRDPRRAADMANAYVEILSRINGRLNSTQGKRKRVFLEGRLKEVRADLEKAEMALKAFQEKYQLVAIDEQARIAIEGAAELQGQIATAQTELKVLKKFGTDKQIEAVMLKARIEELRKQLKSIEKGERQATGDESLNFYLPFNTLPRLGMELMRLKREAKVQEKLFELLTTQYEMARIEEAKDVDAVQVLDEAVTPEKKASPNRRMIVLSSVVIALILSVVLAFVLEYFDDQPGSSRKGLSASP